MAGLAVGPSIQGLQSVSSVTRDGLVISLALVIAIYACGWRPLDFPRDNLEDHAFAEAP